MFKSLRIRLEMVEISFTMHGVLPPLPNTPSWRGAKLKHRDKFTLLYLFTYHVHTGCGA